MRDVCVKLQASVVLQGNEGLADSGYVYPFYIKPSHTFCGVDKQINVFTRERVHRRFVW
jgi:hypothetical protein